MLAACDHTFEAFESTDVHYSVVGYLDASADTQWLRIMPLRRTVAYGDASPLNATVTLETVGQGRSVVLRDSLFAYPSALLQGADTTHAHVFWTTEALAPGGKYRLSVVGNDGSTSTGLVTLPDDYPVTVEYSVLDERNRATVEVDVENLGVVSVRFKECPGWLGAFDNPPGIFDSPVVVPAAVDGRYRVPVDWNVRFPNPPCRVPEHSKVLFVVVSEGKWPSGPAGASWAFPVRDSLTNLWNAEGFLAGIVSKEVPWEPCYMQPRFGPCRLPFTSQSATLVVRVSDPCGDGRDLFPGMNFRLSEVPGAPGQAVRVRDRSPVATIKAIEPGVRYAIRAYGTGRTLDFNQLLVYGEIHDTVTLQPAETRVWEREIPRLISCDY